MEIWMNLLLTRQRPLSTVSIVYLPDKNMCTNVVHWNQYTSSRKFRHVNKSEPSTCESKSYQQQLIKIEINSIYMLNKKEKSLNDF